MTYSPTHTPTHTTDQELLYNKHLHIDGSKIETLGFDYRVPKPTLDLLREVMSVRNTHIHHTHTHTHTHTLTHSQVVDDYVANNQFPFSLVPPGH